MANLKRPKGLIKGAVLLMILTIMFVLIIILMATLTVVSTAQRRTYQKFEQNQSEFTARSCVEYYVGNILKNSKTGTYIAANNDPYFVTAPTAAMTVGRDAELELRTLKSLDCDGSSALPASDPKYHEDNNEAGLYSDTKTSPMSGYTDYSAAEESVKYNITLPKVANSSDQFGKLADDTDNDGYADATIEIFVLDRQFDKGSGATLTEQIANGNRAKDKYTVRIVAKAAFNDYISTVVAIYETDENPPIWNNAMTSITSTTISGAKMNVVGGASAQSPLHFQNDNFFYGPLYYEGNMSIATNAEFSLYAKEAIYVDGDISMDNSNVVMVGTGIDSNPSYNAATDRPTLYINKKMTITVPQTAIGSSTHATMSTVEEEKVDIVVANSANAPYAAVIPGIKHNGDIYIKGNVDLSAVQNAGDFRVNGKVYIDGNVTTHDNWGGNDFVSSYITGGLYVSGTALTSSGGSIVGTVNTFAAGSLNVAIDPATGEFTLPSGDARKVPTFSTQYSDYVKYDTSGNPLAGPVYMTAKEMLETTTSNVKKGIYNDKPFIATATLSPGDISTMGLEAGGNFILTPGTYTGTVTIPDGKTVKILAQQGNYTWYASILTTATVAAQSSSSPLNIGDDNPTYPYTKGSSVYIYIEGASTWTMDEIGSAAPMITGYVYAPLSTLTGNVKGKDLYFRYDGSPVNHKEACFVGSVVFHTINFQDVPALLFIPSETVPTPGDSSLNWTLKYYTRNEESEGLSK